ncbi:MAG: hypothetical protein IJH63_09895 [Methanobrevibacter sp.]|uniref:Uncharacterized protein n=1 Tax=Methanobrevibacter millerae TaxID=230361 RepID=A0A8T3VDJ4_9EURY|nr:hypothetical protein [Methanobrevibacter millerae]MBE6506018.1 hypothetical protein [Methanobrevibacter millerae]MBR0059673.1 hypothetical protein [Methanobrevibacter sp.]MBR0371009.1 hypothetical protein [Methanobrevibacter sp.]
MKIKLAVIYGILIWAVTYVISLIVQPLITSNTLYNNLILPLSMIIVTGFFGILYIREINEDEVIEGIIVGIIFIAIDIVCDVIVFIIPQNHTILITNYTTHLILMSIITLLTTTFLGYLAQMKIELK